MGYCVAPPALMKEFRKVHQFNCFTCHSPVQHALAAFLLEESAYLGLGSFLQQSARPFQPVDETDQVSSTAIVRQSYFQLYSYAAISDNLKRILPSG